MQAKVAQLHEFNPMLGHRGCRLAVTYPAIYRMQARAIIEAALKVRKGVPFIRFYAPLDSRLKMRVKSQSLFC